MTELTIEALRSELSPLHEQMTQMREQMAQISARVDGLPLIGAAIESLRNDVRTLRAAINDMARVNITAGEVEALHADVDKAQSDNLELARRVAVLERRIEELQDGRH
jgi:cell division protein FtsB